MFGFPQGRRRTSMTQRPNQQIIQPETTPLYPSSVYTFDNLGAVNDYYAATDTNQFLYRRNGHPNQRPVEAKLAQLEGGQAATLCASGMAAIAQSCFAHLKPGDQVICTSNLYGGTYSFFENVLRPWGVDVVYADVNDTDALSKRVSSATKVIYAESVANPLLQVTDVPSLGAFAKSRAVKLFIDNTFATPMLMKPLQYGATLSIHSLTKYLNGHSDVLGGVVVGASEDVQPVQQFAVTFGGTLSPFDAWMTERGLHTLHLRFPAQCTNAFRLAEWLEEHPAVKTVWYPGLMSHPSHELAARVLTDGFGGMLSFEVPGGMVGADALVRQLKHIRFAPSLGGVHTTLSHPGLTSHRSYSPAERAQMGIRDGVVRLSVGCEPFDVIVDDLRQALEAIAD
jgi:cystathionine beta-lyase/cystathionine gamma-synthase